ncbi:MAG: 16S rRNA (guanine(527)-N(7))-methyltransferase RsmG [Phycisphaerae bacterium]
MDYPTDQQREFLARCGVDADRSLPIMQQFQQDVADANKRVNLTRITDPDEFWTLHVCDSLSAALVLPRLLQAAAVVADVGCGGGFPIFPLAWANPALTLTGMESRYRKAEFLREQAGRLGLENVEVLHKQAREAGQKPPYRHRYDVVLLRAVGTAGKMVREVRGLLKPEPGATILFYKTPEQIEQELPLAQREADKYSFDLTRTDPLELPHDAGTRQFLILQKQ